MAAVAIRPGSARTRSVCLRWTPLLRPHPSLTHAMHVLFFYQYYHTPDCAAAGRLYHLIERLAKRHRVTVVSTDAWLRQRTTDRYPLVPEGVDLRLFSIPHRNEMNIRQRLSAYARYALQSISAGLRLQDVDLVVGSSTPLTAAWGASVVARRHRVPWIFEVRDLWPDFPIQMGAVRNPLARKALYAVEHALYRSAAHVVTLSPDMEAHVRQQGVPAGRVTTLVNGADFSLAATSADDALPEVLRSDDRAVVLFAGTFGRASDIPTLIDAARRLAHRRDLVFVFVGSGYYRPALEQAATELPNLLVFPPVAHHQIYAWFRRAALSVVSFRDLPVLAANSPAKFFDSLAVGTPVLVTNPGWTRAFVERHRCGWYVPAERPDLLAARIEELVEHPEILAEAGCRGQTVAQQEFDREELAHRFIDLIEQVAAHRPVYTKVT